MKKSFLMIFTILTVGLLTSCVDDPASTENTEGQLALFSTPSGATIYLDGSSTGLTTPDTITTSVGTHSISFQLTNYETKSYDAISISAFDTDADRGLLSADLVPEYLTYGPIKIWETGNGTTVDQPSGVDLSDGATVALSSTGKQATDIYYTGSNFTIRSADLNTANGLTKVTLFKAGASAVLTDGVDSPVQESTWDNSMPDDIGNYYFLYDNDGNYSKFKVTGSGGSAVTGDPAWVEVQWIYVKATDEVKF
ncbi:MAG: PEGA domain-containing protein [Melioribacteraceae bacterium]|nr:PEGA domain-containing protein [Melioribacteraceae bacterium]MCF8263748.1 PEGA domain-containing protein [Melioribacteraceae bacterium]MCF8412671.1 PEGA domain-containing protein [Melioribacteraceae bacterium]MCF8430983.1 PEGA domain-containing protein [Melioribacteraceae bacterium]